MDLANTPLFPPPPGVVSNFVNPENRGGILIAVSAVCLALLLIFVPLRLYTRIRITQSFGLDDGEHALFSPRTLCFWLINDSFMQFCNGEVLLQMTQRLILDCLISLCTRRAL
jgi:hypothetical protein